MNYDYKPVCKKCGEIAEISEIKTEWTKKKESYILYKDYCSKCGSKEFETKMVEIKTIN